VCAVWRGTRGGEVGRGRGCIEYMSWQEAARDMYNEDTIVHDQS
jgi:hypothetical protein